MLKTRFLFLVVVVCLQGAFGQSTGTSAKKKRPQESFVIKKPGEITFTTGIVIEGRVEKPQVILVLSKEKIKINPVSFEKNLLGKITRPVRYNTFEIYKEETQDLGKIKLESGKN